MITPRERRVSLGLLERTKTILLEDGDDDLAVTAVVFHIDQAIEELENLTPDEVTS